MKVKPIDIPNSTKILHKTIDLKAKMSGTNGRQSSYFVDRSLLPRVHRYLKENNHLKFIDVEEMADVLQRQYQDYGRKKKIPFRKSVNQGEIITYDKWNHDTFSFNFKAYEEIRQSLDITKEDGSNSDPEETSRVVAETPEKKSTANESLRSMYSSNHTPSDTKLDDIMVIDVLGDHAKGPPQSTPVKKV